MKTYSPYFPRLLIIFLLFASIHAQAAEFKTQDEVLSKLSAYKVADIDEDVKRLKNKEKLKIDEMFDDLEAVAKFFQGTVPNEDIIFELERVSLLTFLHDPSTFAVDLISSVYEKNQEAFRKAAQRLHPFDRQLILQTLEDKSKASKDTEG